MGLLNIGSMDDGSSNAGNSNRSFSPTPVQGTGETIAMSKGQRLNLTKDNPGLSKIRVGLGWDVSSAAGTDFDLDASAFMLGENGKFSNSDDVIYFNNLSHKSGCITHSADNRTGDGDGDDETIDVTLPKVPGDVQKITFTISIYEAKKKMQNFGQVDNAYARLIDLDTGNELCRFDLTEDYSTFSSIVMAELYRHNGEWKFAAVGKGVCGELDDLCTEFSN